MMTLNLDGILTTPVVARHMLIMTTDSADPIDATKDDIPSKATPKTKKKVKTPGQHYDYGGQRRYWYHDFMASGCRSILPVAIRHTGVDLIN
jgi:hypothetical protein